MNVRIAVVGVGYLGQHHARLLASMDGVRLTAIVDTKPGRADEIASKYGVTGFTQLRDLPLGGIDAATIAVPTVSHLDVAMPLIDAGISVMVEKPIASSLVDADRLIEGAARRGVVLAAGHTERFNPAVVAALPYVSNPRFVEVHRLGTFPERSLDIDVVFDLMIHDLDLLLASVKSEVTSIEAIGVNVLTPRTDIANVRLRFASGCIANVTASRISREKVRKVRYFQRQSYLSIDTAAQEAEMFRLVAQNGRPGIEGGKLDVVRDEPLRAELADFVDAVRHQREPRVTGRAGRDALELATKVAEAMEQSAQG